MESTFEQFMQPIGKVKFDVLMVESGIREESVYNADTIFSVCDSVLG